MLGPIQQYRKLKKRVIRKFAKPVSPDRLRSIYKELGIQRGDVVFVHSSLSKLGNVPAGPASIIEVLLDLIGEEGTLLFPGFNLGSSMIETLKQYTSPQNVYDYRTSKPTTGIICRVFKDNFNPAISIHPTHSILAKGKLEIDFTKDHYKAETTFGIDTPFNKLLLHKAKILGLGSDFGHVTFFHALEDTRSNFPLPVYEEDPITSYFYDENLEVQSKKVYGHRTQECRIEKVCGTWVRHRFWFALLRSNALKSLRINGGKCWAVGANELYNYLDKEMAKGVTIYSKPPHIFAKVYAQIFGWMHEINR